MGKLDAGSQVHALVELAHERVNPDDGKDQPKYQTYKLENEQDRFQDCSRTGFETRLIKG
jgi:hypothetical protein